jgi:hypothetical protein
MTPPTDPRPIEPKAKTAALAESDDPYPVAFDSQLGLKQLIAAVRKSDPGGFALGMAPILGYDLPPRVYEALHSAVLNAEIQSPTIELVADDTETALYDATSGTIRLQRNFLSRAIGNPEFRWTLMGSLLLAFSHHLSTILRNDLVPQLTDAQSPISPDLVLEDGPLYSVAMAQMALPKRDDVRIGTYTLANGDSASIRTSYRGAIERISLQRIEVALPQSLTDPAGPSARFEAGPGGSGHHTHESIESHMVSIGFSETEMQAITFGNWMRDHSQLVDPKLVRAKDTPRNFPSVLSRQTLTQIVDVLAARKFSDVRQNNSSDYSVTNEKLGVYRPSEHIDNPKVLTVPTVDPITRDPDFEPWVLTGDPLLEVDYATSMKRYIHRSEETMREDLIAAMSLGRTEAGLRKLGAGLHILEDFFAHSNFVELCLIKHGYDVLPWTAPANCINRLPLVTGTFGAADAFASIAGTIAGLLKPNFDWQFTPTTPGYRSDSEKMMLILLKESGRWDMYEAFSTYLKLRDEWAATPVSGWVELYRWITSIPARLVGNAFNAMFRAVVTLIGDSVGSIQTLLGADPHTDSTIDPTHSQLAKDHADHPLHGLAAGLASIAANQVATSMVRRWEDGPHAPHPAVIATSFFIHPEDGHSSLDEYVKNWAAANPHLIRRAASKSTMDHTHLKLQHIGRLSFQQFVRESQLTLGYLAEHFVALFKRLF